jgi:hypothetical protein
MADVSQRQFDKPADASATVATDGANATLVTIKIRNANGAPVQQPTNFDLYLSDSAKGYGLTAATASGAVQGKNNGVTGTDLSTYVAKKALYVQSILGSTYQLSITDTAKTAFKVCVGLDDMTFVVAPLSAASYG